MSYPQIKLKQCDYAQITQNKTGDLAMVYKPLQNLIKDSTLGHFTTEAFDFDRYNAQDMLIVDEFDGSTNIIITDDKNLPRLINSGFSVLEDNTFLIPEHYTNVVSNIYENDLFAQDTQLLKLYNRIPTLDFVGLGNGGFKCGSYVFYFRLADSVGNMSNIVQHSSTVQIFIGENNSYKIRMGMLDENANKSVRFKLTNIDSGFDYIRVFYEKTSSGTDQASTTIFYMIDQNFPIINGECDLILTGNEQLLEIPLQDLKNEYADIATCKTQAIVDNTLFLANTSAFVHKYDLLQRLAWCIFPTFKSESEVELPATDASGSARGYYNPLNVYKKVGYWPDEYYRLGIVFIYNNNLSSPAFNILGYDMDKQENDLEETLRKKLLGYDDISGEWNLPEYEPENYIFDDTILSNSKGVIKTNKSDENFKNWYLHFDLNSLQIYLLHTNDLTSDEKQNYYNSGKYDIVKFLQQHHGIKGFFFVRLKRIPTILAQGVVIGLTTRDHGCIPILQDGNLWKTKSFLKNNRLIDEVGDTISTFDDKVVTQALLVPDSELQEATFNLIFTSLDFALFYCNSLKFDVLNSDNWWEYKLYNTDNRVDPQLVKLTAVPKDTTLKTNGTDYFSTVAGNAQEPFKTEDIRNIWNKTAPQTLSKSETLIRGRWGYYVGMSKNNFKFGDLVSIKKSEFLKNPEAQNLLEFQERFSDYSFYSPISTRYALNSLDTSCKFSEFGGDCFPSMFTHRMMTNFIDPELPTNNKIIDHGCWIKNYLVRCTGTITNDAKLNISEESSGFEVYSDQELYSNEIATTFEVQLPINIDAGGLNPAYCKHIEPKEQETSNSGLDLKALFKASDDYELHGSNLINRADINAVSFGQWITFPVRSSMNLALRDIDFSQATEEASFNKKRSFYPLDAMDVTNKLPDSNVINSATKKSIHKNNYPAHKTVPFLKLEYFNRIYWSKPNISDAFLNSYRLIYSDLYKEYNKEFGDITKILPLNNGLFVCFDHGVGVLPIDRSVKNLAEASPYLASRDVLPTLVTTLSKDFGSMWKNSVTLTPKGIIYGVDTIAKKIWRSDGLQLDIISDFHVNKFLNDFIDLSEFDYNAYQGHIDVKTHYNNFKHDVIFTLVKDIPKYTKPSAEKLKELIPYILNFWGSGIRDLVIFSDPKYDSHGNATIGVLFGRATSELVSYNKQGGKIFITYKNEDGKERTEEYNSLTYGWHLTEKTIEVQNGKFYINDIFTGIWCDISSWEPGTVWSLCYNEVLLKWITFYDWYPIESCNVNNIYFSFNLEEIDDIYNQISTNDIYYPEFEDLFPQISNKYFIDKTFSDKVEIRRFEKDKAYIINTECKKYMSFYYRHDSNSTSPKIDYNYTPLADFSTQISSSLILEDSWKFAVIQLDEKQSVIALTPKNGYVDIADIKTFTNLPIDVKTGKSYIDFLSYQKETLNNPAHLRYYEIRDYNPSRMYLWKHGLAGLYDNQGKIRPTHWYGKQHEFNFEFVARDALMLQKIFNNLKMISNKTLPKKFEYEIVGEGYEWLPYKPVVHWINEQVNTGEFPNLDNAYIYVLSNDVETIRKTYPDFPTTILEYKMLLPGKPYLYKKLPYLRIELTDRKGRQDRSYHPDAVDYWKDQRPVRDNLPRHYDYTFNTNETVIKYDPQLNEYRVHDELLGNDMWKYGRVRGNMLYLEDYWNIEIRPITFEWCFIKPGFFLDNNAVYSSLCNVTYNGSKLENIRTKSENNNLSFVILGEFKKDHIYTFSCILFHTLSNAPVIEAANALCNIIKYHQFERQCALVEIIPTEDTTRLTLRIENCNQARFYVTVNDIHQDKTIYLNMYELIKKKISEARHRDKYIKVKVRYSGEDLAVIQAIATLYNESYS